VDVQGKFHSCLTPSHKVISRRGEANKNAVATENRIESYVYLGYRHRRTILMENVLLYVGLTGGIRRALPT